MESLEVRIPEYLGDALEQEIEAFYDRTAGAVKTAFPRRTVGTRNPDIGGYRGSRLSWRRLLEVITKSIDPIGFIDFNDRNCFMAQMNQIDFVEIFGLEGTQRPPSSTVAEDPGFELVAVEQLVKLGAVAARQACCLGDVAAGHLQDAYQVVSLEIDLGLGQGDHLAGLAA